MNTSDISSSAEDGTAYINGQIFTVNESQPWAEAFIVSADGAFAVVGKNEDIEAEAKRSNLVIHDLHGAFIMPGIHDAHVHCLYAGLSQLSNANLGLEEVIPPAEAASKLQTAACGCHYAHAFSQ